MRGKRILILVMAFVITLASGTHAFAATYTDDDRFYNDNNILLYSKDFSAACTSNAGAGASTTDTGNTADAYNYFVKKGLSSIASAAIVGNLKQESGVNPKAQNSIGAYGIAQWLNDRKTKLKTKDGYDTLPVQLDYIWSELNGGYGDALNILKKYTGSNASKLAVDFGQSYEGYGDGEEGSRGQYAADIFKQYGGAGATTGLGDSCSTIGNGDFVYYSQTDPKWATKPYGSGTVGIDGCGPTSLAMIVATLFDKTVTPDVMAKLGADNGSYGPDVGTYHTKLLSAASQQYNFTYTDMTNDDIDKLVSVVQGGGLVYLAGQGAAPFTSAGHIVVMRGVTSDGKIIIADPYRGESDTYTKAQIEAGRGSTFGISKS